MHGTIAKETCFSCFEDIVRKSNEIGDNWELKVFQDDKYLQKKEVLHVSCRTASHIETDLNELVDDEECISHDTVSINKDLELVSLEYHIVYCESYSVPVLYFNAYTSSGQLLTLEQMWGLVPHSYLERLEQDRWTFLTQAEHPYLGRPFFMLHPCHTDKLMSALSNHTSAESQNYVISWLSAVGPVVLLNISPQYGMQKDTLVLFHS